MAKKKTRKQMQVVAVPLGELVLDPKNARRHPEKNMAAIKKSLEKFGQVEPLVVRQATKQVIGGNGRLETMVALGWTHADVVFVDVDSKKATALGVALNRTSELALWDFEALSGLLGDMSPDLQDVTGWAPHEIEPLLAANWSPAQIDPEGLAELNASKVKDGAMVRMTPDQRKSFDNAAELVRMNSGTSLPDGEVVRVLAEFYCAGK